MVTTDVMTSDTLHDHRRDDVEDPRAPRTEQVRIVGAERAADAVSSDLPDAARHAAPLDRATEPDDEWGPEDWALPAEPQLPHWTEAPTGEIPAVLSRAEEGEEVDPWASLPEPTWREAHHDWEHAESLGASLFAGAGDDPALISETDEEERQPWSFDLGGADARASRAEATWRTATTATADAVVGTGTADLGTGTADLGTATADLGTATADLGTGTAAIDTMTSTDTGELGGAAALGGPGELGELLEIAVEAELEIAGERTTVLRLPGSSSSGPGRGAAGAAGRAREGEGEGAPRAPRAPRAAPLPSEPGGRPLEPRTPGRARGGDDALSQRTGRNIPAAVLSGVVIGAVALLAFHFGPVPSLAVVTIVLTAAAIEAYAAFRRSYRPATLLGIVAVAGLVVGTYDRPFVALPVVVVLLVAATFLWHLVGVDRRADPVRSTAATLLVFSWVGVFGSYGALLLAPSLFPHRTGIAYLLGALIAGVAYDVGALAVGAWLGRHPLSAVSPSKTWEGLAGGTVAAIVLSVAVVRLVHPWTLGEAAVLGVVVAVVSPVGDLCESMVKRRLGLKDMGRILPGHGGLLDRLDGLLFVLPATYYLVRAFGHG